MVHTSNLDLNLLVILECLFRLQNVSSVAKELRLTQSAISHSLSRLRVHFDDPLFVRISKGVAPTEFAKSIRLEVEDVVSRVQLLAQKRDLFDPFKAEGRFVIATTDYFEVVAGVELLKRLRQEAPRLQISFRPTSGALPKEQLENGTCDLAIAGFYSDLPEGFYRQHLFSDTFSTGFRQNHSILKKHLTSETFFECEHALITLQGDFKDIFELPLKGGGFKRRNILVGSSSFTALAWTLASTDLVLTAPTLLLKRYAEFFPIQVQQCPLPATPLRIQMIWHQLTHQNLLKKWVRQTIKEVCAQLSGE